MPFKRGVILMNYVKKVVNWVKGDLIVFVYGIISLVLELGSLIFFDFSPHIEHPVYPGLLWLTSLFILFLFKRKWLKAVFSILFLTVQTVIIMGCNYLYLSNGTAFEKSMINQRNDAYGTIEKIYFTPGLIYLLVSVLLAYILFLTIYLVSSRKNGTLKLIFKKNQRISYLLLSVISISFILLIPFNEGNASIDYKNTLYKSDNSYQNLGITANLIYELLQKPNSYKVAAAELNQLDESIYSKRADTSIYNGISTGNNLVMILAESFEFYPLEIYPNEISKKIYPNLNRLLADGVTFDHFYAREKTDNSEALSLVGSNPTGKYVHNDFQNNTYPYALPNLFRQQAIAEGDGDVAIRSFHQNRGSFYNRSTAHKNFGFDELVDIYKMKEFGVVDTWHSSQRERNLDSLTMAAMKDEMFPKDQRFFSYWITFSTHGFYKSRETLEDYYKKFDQLGVFPEGDEYQNYLRTYAAAVADLDKAVGIMFEDLEEKGILDKTTILLFSDHNSYYNKLSNYAKGIESKYNPELYRIPMVIYDQKLTNKMAADGESKTVSKFTTTADIIPTLLDLFGIPGWDNLYLGSTAFNKDKESIIYSRAYNIFLNETYMGYSLNNLKFEAPDATDETKADFETRALRHLNKLAITDEIFYSDYFSDHTYRP